MKNMNSNLDNYKLLIISKIFKILKHYNLYNEVIRCINKHYPNIDYIGLYNILTTYTTSNFYYYYSIYIRYSTHWLIKNNINFPFIDWLTYHIEYGPLPDINIDFWANDMLCDWFYKILSSKL